MTTKQIKELLNFDIDTISKRNSIFTVRKGFFYRHGKSTQDLIDNIKAKILNAIIIDSGEHWAAFRGGASVANSSHWFVKFTV